MEQVIISWDIFYDTEVVVFIITSIVRTIISILIPIRRWGTLFFNERRQNCVVVMKSDTLNGRQSSSSIIQIKFRFWHCLVLLLILVIYFQCDVGLCLSPRSITLWYYHSCRELDFKCEKIDTVQMNSMQSMGAKY